LDWVFGTNNGIDWTVMLSGAAVMRWHKCGGNKVVEDSRNEVEWNFLVVLT
jgi:hypothetical protein